MANDINTVTFSGRLTRDAELKYSPSGTAICKFSLANNYSMKKGDQWEEKANFFDFVMFGRRAEALSKYLEKGKQLIVACEARHNRWQNNEGQNRSKVEFVVQALVFGSGGGKGNGQANGQSGGQTGGQSGGYDPAAEFNESVDDGGFEDDPIPF